MDFLSQTIWWPCECCLVASEMFSVEEVLKAMEHFSPEWVDADSWPEWRKEELVANASLFFLIVLNVRSTFMSNGLYRWIDFLLWILSLSGENWQGSDRYKTELGKTPLKSNLWRRKSQLTASTKFSDFWSFWWQRGKLIVIGKICCKPLPYFIWSILTISPENGAP